MSESSQGASCKGVLLLEPFYGGSHRQLIDLLSKSIPECALYTLPASKWHWRARTSALYFSCEIPNNHNFSVLFASSVLNLAELVALRPDLAGIRKILYFHENQLVYPVQKQQDRDFQYGYNQILSCLVADAVVFNSTYNQESFLVSIESFLKLMPNRPRNLAERIRPKCQILYFPIDFPPVLSRTLRNSSRSDPSNISKENRQSQVRHPSDVPTVSNNTSNDSSELHRGESACCQQLCQNGSELSHDLMHTEDKKMFIPSSMRTKLLGDQGNNEDNLSDDPETKHGRTSRDGSHDNQIISLSSVEVLEEGKPSQDIKESKVASGVCIEHQEEKEFDQHVKCLSLPFSRTATEQCHEDDDSFDLKESSCPVFPCDNNNGCHDNMDHKRSEMSFDNDEKVLRNCTRPLHILWPHRWEHDKNPEQFFSTLFQLSNENCSFHLSVLGENYLQTPSIFKEAEIKLKDHIVNWGFVPSKECYYRILSEADVVVSTANHEFFGVAMLEATYFHCYPVCPEHLVYPEIFPVEHLYRTPAQLHKKLRRFCRNPSLVRCHKFQADLSKYSWETLERDYLKLLQTT